MHLNAHLAIGTLVAFAGIALVPVELSFLEVVAIILSACAIDADFLLTKYARDQNHRMLPTHGVAVPVACVAGFVLTLFLLPAYQSLPWTLLLCGTNVLVHQIVDSVDWGLDFFHAGRLVGARILLGGKSAAEFRDDASRYMPSTTLFYHVYYHHRGMIAAEIASACAMVAALVAWPGLAAMHWWIPVLYAVLLVLHVAGYKMQARQIRDPAAREK